MSDIFLYVNLTAYGDKNVQCDGRLCKGNIHSLLYGKT